MPRATQLHLRLVLDHLARLGATASDISRQLSLPLSTVRELMRRAAQAGPNPDPAVLQPHYHACGRRSSPVPWVLETTLALRRQNPRWGGGRIHIELQILIEKMSLDTPLPCTRTLQRYLHRHGLAPGPPGRSRGSA